MIETWTCMNINYRRRNYEKQNESKHEDWADVECHKSYAKTINSPKLSHKPLHASKPSHQKINFWLIHSHVSQLSEITFHISVTSKQPLRTCISPGLRLLYKWQFSVFVAILLTEHSFYKNNRPYLNAISLFTSSGHCPSSWESSIVTWRARNLVKTSSTPTLNILFLGNTVSCCL